MVRVMFTKGKQRKFMQQALINLNCPSLRALNQFGFDINYQTLKSYFNENRMLPSEFFDNLCILSGLHPKVKLLEDNWGQKLGSLVSAKVKNKKRQFLRRLKVERTKRKNGPARN